MAHRWVDHTAELELHVTAATEAAVFDDALDAFADDAHDHGPVAAQEPCWAPAPGSGTWNVSERR